MTRPIQTLVHIDSMRRNLAAVRKRAGKRFLWAVVKANAYGHGLINALAGFAAADGMAIIDIEDIYTLRTNSWTKPILLLEGFFTADDIPVLDRYEVDTIVHNWEMVKMLKAAEIEKVVRVHVKVNTGMNRLGFTPEEAPAALEELSRIPGVEVVDFVTHFANAEPTASDKPTTTEGQLARLRPLVEAGGRFCLANSAATVFHEEIEGHAVRPGIVLYGLSPDDSFTSEAIGLEPAMTLRAKIIALQHVKKGDSVGYGSRFVARRDSRIAVVACGYADGYPRSMPDTAKVWVEGRYAPLAGNVSMDMLAIDVTDVDAAQLGSWVELWGKHVSVNEIARLAGTIGYELVCSLTRRVPVLSDPN